MKLRIATAAALAAMSMVGQGWAQAQPVAPPTPAEQAALAAAVERGHTLFLLDEAAWVGTDEMRRKIADPSAAGLAGWIVEPQGDHQRTVFFARKGPTPVAAFVVDTRGQTVISSHMVGPAEEAALTPVELRMVAARDAALKLPRVRCTDGGMNTVVIPPASADAPVDVYVLSAQVKADEYPLGGHQLFRIGPNGEVVSQRKFTNSCITLKGGPQGTAQAAGMVVTHLLDTTPTEIHVFTSEASGLPVFVMASPTLPPDPKAFRLWKVDHGAITLMDKPAG